jgi:hypothetical protein
MPAKPWTTPDDLRKQLRRYWDAGRLLTGESPFPLALKVRGPDSRALAERFDEVRQWIRDLEAAPGFAIEWADVNHRQLGRNRVPARILVPDEASALAILGRKTEAARFRALAAHTVNTMPLLAGWLVRKPLVALAHLAEWERILAVLTWFREHPRSGLYLRQLDIAGVDTKFIESHKALLAELLDIVLLGIVAPPSATPTPDEIVRDAARSFESRYGLVSKPPQVRLRILDHRLTIRGLTDIAVTAQEFAKLELGVDRVFITENEINGLAFPQTPWSLVIFGLGYGLERLSEVRWLRHRRVHYWGDIDTYGFHILDRLRGIFPTAQSFLMDRETYFEHRKLWVPESTPFHGELTRLTPEENALYHELQGNRLEQERIRFGWVERALAELPPRA